MSKSFFDLVILYEHPEWHEPLFAALHKAGINYATVDLKNGAADYESLPEAKVYYNMVSPSAYKRGNQRAIPYARALCKMLDYRGKRVLNGSASNDLEFSKSAQVAMLSSIKANHPESITFNSVAALKERSDVTFPRILKPEQGGSGARMYLIHSFEELETLLQNQPELWLPDNLLLLQQKLENNTDFGIVRVEFVGRNFLYAMRVVTHGSFNLCPSVVCNPEDASNGICDIPQEVVAKPEFYPYLDISDAERDEATRVFNATGHDIGSVEYLITPEGKQVFYDINANSNLRVSIGQAWGFDPFEKVIAYLKNETEKNPEGTVLKQVGAN